MRQQLLGPKSFDLERMLAIFYNIIDDKIPMSIDVQKQIASLITLRLLVRVTKQERLETVRCKCNVGFDLVHQVAQSVGFELGRYLYDFRV
ncbi:origin recognition complex subunit [Blyttiomyces helicus]|uniref:Origin recognition complex subunit n=1 Tax=Blyttiomyces helicus TaxID=388810 RepID=A0A4V1IQ58_9FUNG|nr:origin recognition complex subunit [Blyttiomyces helicus]|eukprot:RKO85407.1 origin recognition complex subunit [Blyttiomyces helicus]